ncbi:hypothetical protein SERLA73DRAFT_77673 [Serpula lacrymans var. lacrymans S7.3]|uniref:Uncharacterized protein n=2 Tax=Serpula lacrymans var. lacrymans TaxID=341189 RepID=F8QBN6_SERL3|nr:hypothetical protein SERLA73DRAFT_80495 [Serpula lacrymans var. lacrymans S7.3]EGN94247.1 hypothetical protein SERLA73DRAFT_77673 [Serpula lacrymans var. lacrymans S7.3]
MRKVPNGKAKCSKPWSEWLSGGGPLVKLSTLLQTGGGNGSTPTAELSTPLNTGGRVSGNCPFSQSTTGPLLEAHPSAI